MAQKSTQRPRTATTEVAGSVWSTGRPAAATPQARNDLAARRRTAFGARLRAFRHERGWSQEQLAHAAGLDRTYIGSVERGERNIALDNIWLIADTLEVTPAELIN